MLSSLVPPVVHTTTDLGPEIVTSPEGESIVLQCIVEAGNPFPSIEWYKGKILLEER